MPDDMSFIPGGLYLACVRFSSGLGASRCGLGTGGAGLCGIVFGETPPGGFGAGRNGSKLLPFVCGLTGDFRPNPCAYPPGTGGGARGFSKLSPPFLGNRGLAGGLIICCCPYPPGLKAPFGDIPPAGVSWSGLSFALALSNL